MPSCRRATKGVGLPGRTLWQRERGVGSSAESESVASPVRDAPIILRSSMSKIQDVVYRGID